MLDAFVGIYVITREGARKQGREKAIKEQKSTGETSK